jgi:hypothetical protein
MSKQPLEIRLPALHALLHITSAMANSGRSPEDHTDLLKAAQLLIALVASPDQKPSDPKSTDPSYWPDQVGKAFEAANQIIDSKGDAKPNVDRGKCDAMFRTSLRNLSNEWSTEHKTLHGDALIAAAEDMIARLGGVTQHYYLCLAGSLRPM